MLNSSNVLAPLFGPESIAMSACVHGVSSPWAGFGSLVNTVPTCWSPHGAALVDCTWPDSVVTAPPAAFWYGSGISTFCLLGQSHAAPARTRTPIAMSSPTTILAANGPNGDGPSSECEWAWECVTRTRVEVAPQTYCR